MCRTTRNLLGLLLLAPLAAAELPQQADDIHLGVATCAASQCHGSAAERAGSNVQQNEYVTWTSHDPHSGAYRTLLTDESAEIARRLGLPNAQTSALCLDCHADNVPMTKRGERFQVSDGVGCEACHGGAERWIDSHYAVATITHADNLAAGLYPGERPADRAELCLSCHLGNDNKFASHRIMAAGHPRLQFELDTFTELWRTAGGSAHYRVDDDYRERKGDTAHVDTWAAALVADAGQRLALLNADLATPEQRFPELGLYDCHACHRSMKTVQWRRLERHGDAPPGMPFVADGSFVMSMVLARAVQPDLADTMRDALADLHAARTSVDQQAASAALAGRIGELRQRLARGSLVSRQAAIRDALIDAGAAGEYLDYGSAEQAFMAIQMLAFEMQDTRLQELLDGLAGVLDDDERYRPVQFARLLRESQRD